MMRNRGLFIVLEGCDGAGHGTQAGLLKGRMEQLGLPVILTREPGGTVVGEAIRSIFIRKDLSPTVLTQVFLCAAFRAQHVEEKIRPALEDGIHVISERYYYSTLAYQHFADGQSRELIETTTKMATNGLEPDLAIILDLPPEMGLKRKTDAAVQGGPELDRFELKERTFHQKVRQGFLAIAQEFGFPVIDGSRHIKEVEQKVFELVRKKLEERPIQTQ